MVKIMARISARADTVAPVRQILTELAVPSRRETGCISYELFQDEDNPLDFITIENWVDGGAADAHLATPHVAAAISRAGSLLAQPPLIHRFAQLA